MKANMGTADRVIRLIAAALIVYLFINETISGTWGLLLIVFAVIFALTSFISFCPLYLPFKFSTKKES